MFPLSARLKTVSILKGMVWLPLVKVRVYV